MLRGEQAPAGTSQAIVAAVYAKAFGQWKPESAPNSPHREALHPVHFSDLIQAEVPCPNGLIAVEPGLA